LGNFLFAWAILSIGFLFGLPTSHTADYAKYSNNSKLIITTVRENTPAGLADIKPGSQIESIVTGEERGESEFVSTDPEETGNFIDEYGRKVPLIFNLVENGQKRSVTLRPEAGILSDRYAIGIGLAEVSTVKLPFYLAPIAGMKATIVMTVETAKSLYGISADIFKGRGGLDSIAGPVGIAGLVKDAKSTGWSSLMVLVALISVNLTLINLIPIPALDGGRLLFLGIENVIGRKIPDKISMAVNGIGLLCLLLFMLIISINDLYKIFG